MAIGISLFAASLRLPMLPLLFMSGVLSIQFNFENKCTDTVWPGILSNAGTANFPTTGFALSSGQSRAFAVSRSWSGRLWGRTGCTQDPATANFSCATGNCGSGKAECDGTNAAPPATLAEFTLDGSGGVDFFDVSLVDGYNLPMLVTPQGGSGGNCTPAGCTADLNGACPEDLRVKGAGGGRSVACRSACDAFREAQYCCSGQYGSPASCHPSSYSRFFKDACPQAYSYAYDDKTSTFTCADADYLITFCPAPAASKESAAAGTAEGGDGDVNSMVYEGAMESVARRQRVAAALCAVAAAVAVVT